MTAPLRPLARIAWRDVVRNRARSALVVALVAIPVAAAVAGLTVFRTTDPTPAERATSAMGRATLVVDAFDDRATTDDLTARLPRDSEVEPVGTTSAAVAAEGGVLAATEARLDLTGLAAGMYELRDGRLPADDSEVAASATVLDATGADLGEEVLVDGERRTVVGLVRDPERLSSRLLVAPPDAAAAGGMQARWLVGLPDPSAAEQVAADLRSDDAYGVQTRADGGRRSSGESAALVLLGGLGLVEAALIASAAFAVSTRRRQRELGLLAATGGHPGHLRRVVLLSGVLLGALGAAAGAVVGVVGVRLVVPQLQSWSDRALEGIVVDPAASVAMVVLGVAAAAAAAWVPARAAARLPLLTALAGRRPPAAPSARGLTKGLVLIGVGVALVLASAPVAASLGGDSLVATALLLVGSVASVLGFGMTSPWLLEQIGRLAPRLGVGSRLAVRDTARFRSRNGPIVTAVLSGLALSVALGTGLTSLEADEAAAYRPMLRNDQLLIMGTEASEVATEVAGALDVAAAGAIGHVRSVAGDPSTWLSFAPVGDGVALPGFVVGDGGLVRALGGDDAAVAAVESGSVVVFDDAGAAPEAVTTLVVDDDVERDLGIHLPVHVAPVPTGDALPDVVVQPDTLATLGIEVAVEPVSSWVLRLPSAVTGDQAEVATDVAAGTFDTTVVREEGFSSNMTRLGQVVLLAAVATGLVVLAIALTLAAAETRSDQRTLLAVGADPVLRRSIAAGRAAVLGGLGGVLAVPAGLLPVFGLLRSASDIPLVVPWGSLALVGLGTPLLAVAGAWLLTRPSPAWTAYRAAG